MRSKNDIVAIFCADLHLSLSVPIWRSAEPDWFEAMKRPLLELSNLQEEYQCPVICAGDIFDRWNSPPELINFALEYLPEDMYAIPGQHDLPLHRLEDIEKSAYWTLAKAGRIVNLPKNDLINIPHPADFTLYPFPFGMNILPIKRQEDSRLHIAIAHQYVWIPGYGYEGALQENRIYPVKGSGKLMGYDITVYGDNHKGFLTEIGETTIFNCGTFLRRKSDEINYRPQVGLLQSNGKIIRHYLDTTKDKYLKLEDESKLRSDILDMKAFFHTLQELGSTTLDFTEAIKEYIQTAKVSSDVKRIILTAMEKI